jgi:GNAT superfamily N-acetyltransferase
MPIIVKPLERADCEEWMEIHYRAFQPTLSILWHREPSKESFRILAERRSSALTEPGSHVFKAVDTDADNKIIGVANWHVHPEQRDPEELKKSLGQPFAIPEVNIAAREVFMGNINQSRVDIMGPAPVVMLGTLTIRPEYQRKGVGSLLMKFGIEEADR